MDAILYGQIIIGVIGLALGAALVWWWASSRHTAHLAKIKTAQADGSAIVSPSPLPQPDSRELQHEAEAAAAQYHQAIEEAASRFSQDLGATSQLINDQIKRMSVDIISNELEGYRSDIEDLRKQAASTLGQVTAAVQEERQKLQAAMETEVAAEKERRLAELDAKLGEAVSSFLLETLKHNVDLGAQSAYLMDTLEEHKAELVEEVRRGA